MSIVKQHEFVLHCLVHTRFLGIPPRHTGQNVKKIIPLFDRLDIHRKGIKSKKQTELLDVE